MSPGAVENALTSIAVMCGEKTATALREHIAALKAEATYMNHATLEKAARACADECDNLEPHNIACACSHHEDARRIRALKSKPAQEAHTRGCMDASSGSGDPCVCRPREMASEENGLLPKKRRREHEYGEDTKGHFGSRIAKCVRPGCEAFRVKGKRFTQFHQKAGAEASREPGPCEVES